MRRFGGARPESRDRTLLRAVCTAIARKPARGYGVRADSISLAKVYASDWPCKRVDVRAAEEPGRQLPRP